MNLHVAVTVAINVVAVAMAENVARCLLSFVLTAERKLKFLSSRETNALFTAVIASVNIVPQLKPDI